MKRRDFIKGAALLVAAAGSGETLRAAVRMDTDEATDEGGPLIASAPMLQNFAETSIGIAFAVSALANGYVIYGERSDLSDGKKVKCGGGPKLSEKAFPTVIEGKVEGRELRITVHNITTGAVQDSFSIKR